MRKTLTLIAGTLITGSIFAGGLVTNTNQSASWVRLPSRNASTEVDAAYYNPAGLMMLPNGFHFSVSNQTIFQSREIENSYAGPGGAFGLNEHLYKGKVFAPFFPSAYAVYKRDKIAVSLGMGPVGGGGGATYEKGLPSFEMGMSDLVPSLASQGATAYSADIYFKGSSLYLGFQGALSYKVSDMLSVAAGVRYVSAKNSYSGHLQSVNLTMGGVEVPATTVFNGIVSNLTGIIGIPTSLAPAIAGGFGGATLAALVAANQMTAAQKTAIEQGLVYIGVPSAALPTMTVSTISATVTGATPTLMKTRATAAATSTLVADKTAEAEQTGYGITPFLNLNFTPTDGLNIAVKYEFATKIELTNNTAQDLLVGYTLTGDSITQFPDGEKVRNDMPAMLGVGFDYRISPKFKIAMGGNYYWDNKADYGHTLKGLLPSTPPAHIDNKYIIDHNGFSIQGGAEYNLSDNLLVSGGYIYANKGVNGRYQSDMTFANATQTFGAGIGYGITEKIKVNFGTAYTVYQKDTQNLSHYLSGTYTKIDLTESYKKGTFMFGIGLDISL